MLDDWKTNKTVYGCDLSPDLCLEGFHMVKYGNLLLKLKFADTLGENVAVFIFEDRDNLLELDLQ